MCNQPCNPCRKCDEQEPCSHCLEVRGDIVIAVCGHPVCCDCSILCEICSETLCPVCAVKDSEGNWTCGGECLADSEEMIGAE